MIEVLAQIRGPKPGQFAAGIVLRDDVVIEAAPIVWYMKLWPRARVRDYCRERGWQVSVVRKVCGTLPVQQSGHARGKQGDRCVDR